MREFTPPGLAVMLAPKAQAPDLASAERYYDAALRLQPQHRGALEYSGELFLMLGDLPRAEQRLATLDKACTLPCAEYTELKNAVARCLRLMKSMRHWVAGSMGCGGGGAGAG